MRSILILCNLLLIINSAPLNDEKKNPMLGDFFQGDIAGVEKGVSSTYYDKWTGGIVPYAFDPYTFTVDEQNTILSGMRLIEDQTRINGRDCIKFVPRSNQQYFLRVMNGQGCWSYIGNQYRAGGQQLSIQRPSCVYKGIVAHEFMHALGFWHEQSRQDRDNFVRINWQNIDINQQYNFNKENNIDYLGYGYDYYSIMHYEWNAFSTNGRATIEPLQSGVVLKPAWEKYALSNTDVAEIRKLYGCY